MVDLLQSCTLPNWALPSCTDKPPHLPCYHAQSLTHTHTHMSTAAGGLRALSYCESRQPAQPQGAAGRGLWPAPGPVACGDEAGAGGGQRRAHRGGPRDPPPPASPGDRGARARQRLCPHRPDRGGGRRPRPARQGLGAGPAPTPGNGRDRHRTHQRGRGHPQPPRPLRGSGHPGPAGRRRHRGLGPIQHLVGS